MEDREKKMQSKESKQNQRNKQNKQSKENTEISDLTSRRNKYSMDLVAVVTVGNWLRQGASRHRATRRIRTKSANEWNQKSPDLLQKRMLEVVQMRQREQKGN